MPLRSLEDIDLKGKRVFFRFDFNVPLDQAGSIKDDTRIVRALPTIKYAVEHGAKSILASHLGRPKGEKKPEMSLKPVAERLSQLLGKKVDFVADCIGDEVKKAVAELPEGGVLLLENLRFYAGETKNDPAFAAELASLADVYINDAFGTAHRAHASTAGMTKLVAERGAGFLLKEELDNLGKAFSDPAKPVVAIFGGAKVSDKLAVLQNILDKMDVILIGGGMANTFLKSRVTSVGTSKIEEDLVGTASEILALAERKACRILLPSDVVVAEIIEAGAPSETVDVDSIPQNKMALDIGPKTIAKFGAEIEKAGTIIWNGPMGVFEIDDFKTGTMEIGLKIANAGAFSLIGGGDTIRAAHQAGIADKISYISTGGGAFMEFLEGKTLPGVAALED